MHSPTATTSSQHELRELVVLPGQPLKTPYPIIGKVCAGIGGGSSSSERCQCDCIEHIYYMEMIHGLGSICSQLKDKVYIYIYS